MPLTFQLPLSATRKNLQRLMLIRMTTLLAQLSALYFVWRYLNIELEYAPILSMLGLLAPITLITFWRLRQKWLVSSTEYFSQLLLDALVLTVLLYFSGGATNPFISYYLVILTICAGTLPWAYTWSIAALTIIAYSGLLFYYQPLMPSHHSAVTDSQTSLFNLHILGMWLTFLISTLLITYFVVKMAQAIRQQENYLATQREITLQDEQLLAVATLAAGTAHELGTPLSTLSVLVGEMQFDHAKNKTLQLDLELLDSQLNICKQSMRKMMNKFSMDAQTQMIAQPVDIYMEDLLERWQLIRPEAQTHYQVLSPSPVPLLEVDETMSQAIINLLNNALDACPERVDIKLHWDDELMTLGIRDYGAGIAPELAEKLGKPFITTKNKGLGLGLYLSHATVRRFSGRLTQYNHKESGTLTELQLPISTINNISAAAN